MLIWFKIEELFFLLTALSFFLSTGLSLDGIEEEDLVGLIQARFLAAAIISSLSYTIICNLLLILH
jgi:hypothetical protein